MTYPEHRSEEVIRLHERERLTAEQIDAYNHGYQWHLDNFNPHKTRDEMLAAGLMQAPYTIFDESELANMFWEGFEGATLDRIKMMMETARGHYDPVTEATRLLEEEGGTK